MTKTAAEKAYEARFPNARRLDGLARDEEEEYAARAQVWSKAGSTVLAKWCKENLSRKDVEKLIGELEFDSRTLALRKQSHRTAVAASVAMGAHRTHQFAPPLTECSATFTAEMPRRNISSASPMLIG